MREENAFENQEIAEEWIQAIESEKDGSRDLELYPLLNRWSKELALGVLVEIGSGQGICSSKVDIGNGKYIGIEPSAPLVQRAKTLYPEPNKEFLIGNAYEVPLENGAADAAFSVGVWFHMEDLDRAHQELARILKSKGEILIVTSNSETHSRWESWFEHTSKEEKKIVGKVALPGGSLSKNIFYLHTEREVIDSLTRNGFEIISVEKFGFGKGGKAGDGIWMAMRALKK